MAKKNNIIVPGYSKKIFYTDGIEYRPFNPDLVGLQLANTNENTPLFTMGNFNITTNTSPKQNLNYASKDFSKYYTLEDISVNGANTTSISTNVQVSETSITPTLNFDYSDLGNFAYFGSTKEFIRVSLEHIITTWPASLFITPINKVTGNMTLNVLNYNYDVLTNKSSLKIDTNNIRNQYDLVFDSSGFILTDSNNNLRNLTIYYKKYVLFNDIGEFEILNFTPSLNVDNDFIIIDLIGNPFPNINGDGYANYHIKPNQVECEKFLSLLPPFENYLLNRLTSPKYSSNFSYQFITEEGLILNGEKTLVWPTSDGYNLDFETNEYSNYVNELLTISDGRDETTSNLMVRFLVSDSISDFDSIPDLDGTQGDSSGQKMTKLLNIYGREFDEIKKYIDGISFVNNVTYDKKNNLPDQLIKYLGKTLGWELTNSLIDDDLIKSYLTSGGNSYSGLTRGLTPIEAEQELWRRLVLNSAWLFKSKGTRKAIEFIFKFIGAPEGLINLNEHVYVAKDKIDINEFYDTLDVLGLNTDLDFYNLDSDGYPKTFRNDEFMYFQKGGLWYKETFGESASTHLLTGNNPHIGPYDGGKEYINQFESILPINESVVLTSSTINKTTEELFVNYNNGVVNNYTGNTYFTPESISGVNLDDCYVVTSNILSDPKPEAEKTDCGCEPAINDKAIIVNVNRKIKDDNQINIECQNKLSGYTYIISTENEYFNQPLVYLWEYKTYNIDDTLNNNTYVSPYISPKCCKSLVNGLPYLYDDYNIVSGETTLLNSGYVCCKPSSGEDPGINGCGCYITCKWRLAGPLLGYMYALGDNNYLKFITPKNNWGEYGDVEYRVTNESDSCFCPSNWTTPEKILDPYTGNLGWACKLNQAGKNVMTLNYSQAIDGTINSDIYQFYYKKSNGVIGCKSIPTLTTPPNSPSNTNTDTINGDINVVL